MPLPLAHGLISASVVAALLPHASIKRDWKPLLLGAGLGICPDLDYVLNLFPGLGGGWHHGFTHSFAFAFIAGFLAALLANGGRVRLRAVMLYSLATLSHPLLDLIFTESRGVELFWPVSGQRFTLRLPNPIYYSWRDTPFRHAFVDLLRISLLELVIYAPVFLIILWVKRGADKRSIFI